MTTKTALGPFPLYDDTLPVSGGYSLPQNIDCDLFDTITLFITYTPGGTGGRPAMKWSVDDGLGHSFEETALGPPEPGTGACVADLDTLLVRMPARAFSIKHTLDVTSYRKISFRFAEIVSTTPPGALEVTYSFTRVGQ